MKILIGDAGNIDFDAPVKMNEAELLDFINFLKIDIGYSVIERVNSEELRTQRLGSKRFMKYWSDAELEELLSLYTIEELTEKLGRTWMSVDIKRGIVVLYYRTWMNNNGFTESTPDLVKKFVKEYLEKRKQKRHKEKFDVLYCKECPEHFDPKDPKIKNNKCPLSWHGQLETIKWTKEEWLEYFEYLPGTKYHHAKPLSRSTP